MDEKDFSLEKEKDKYSFEEDGIETLETTKEVLELKDLIPNEDEDAEKDFKKVFDVNSM